MNTSSPAASPAAALRDLLLREPRWNVAVAESLTCGRVQALIGAVSGASDYFAGGITAYSLEQKVAHLSVDRMAAEAVNCVSAQVAEQMARGVARLFRTNWGVGTTGYAEPWAKGGVDVPFAWWAVYQFVNGRPEVLSGQLECPGASRTEVQQRVAEEAVAQLARQLAKARTAEQ
jgi:nicotinamide-nucleotide amidase